MENNPATAATPFADAPQPERRVAVRKQGAVKQVFGHFTRKEFWIDLLEMIVKNAATAFFIALGKTLVEYGKKRGGATSDVEIFETRTTPAQSPAATAFSRGYTPSSDYRPLSYPPASRSADEAFPGFPSR